MLGKIEETFASLGNSIENLGLNNKIAEAKKDISKIYAEIGEKYYASHKDEIPAEFADQFEAIRQRFAVIDEIGAQIRKNSGIRQCPECGADVDKNSRFCVKCGTKVPEEKKAAEVKTVCSKCGAEYEEGAKFCTTCGTKLVAVEKAPELVCERCGAKLDKEAKFCTKCGLKVELPVETCECEEAKAEECACGCEEPKAEE